MLCLACAVASWHGIEYPALRLKPRRSAPVAPEAVAASYGDIHEVPVTILIDPQGRIRRRFDGARDPETLRSALREIGVPG